MQRASIKTTKTSKKAGFDLIELANHPSFQNAVIYPFQLEVSYQCQMCWACYHKNCYSNNGAKCTKCSRIQARKQLAVDPQLG